MRWFIALLLIALTGSVLVGVKERTSDPASFGEVDEILAYEIDPARPIALAIPGGVGPVFVTVWAIVSPAEKYDALREYDFGFEATLESFQGVPLVSRRFYQNSRISADPRAPAHGSSFIARLDRKSDWVTDARTAEVDTIKLGQNAGRMRMRALPGQCPRLLLRVTYRQPRLEFEKHMYEQSLDISKRRALVDRRASLGFFDLPSGAKDRALATWNRRIPALGHRDIDYVEQKLLIGSLRPLPSGYVPEQSATEIGPERRAVLNVVSSLTLRGRSEQTGTLSVGDPLGGTRSMTLTAERDFELPLTGAGLRSVELSAPKPMRLHLTTAYPQVSALAGEVPREPDLDGRVVVAADFRKLHLYQLDWMTPVSVRLAKHQDVLGVVVRAKRMPGERNISGKISARWSTATGRALADADLTLTPSFYDVFADASAATEPKILFLRVPSGAEQLDLFGDARLAAAVWSREPEVPENRLNAAYPEPPRVDQVWRNAVYDLRSWAALAPINSEALAQRKRALTLLAQARLEDLASKPAIPRPERALAPEGTPLRLELFTRAWLARGFALPDNAWTPLEGNKRVRIESTGALAGRLQILYRADRGALGNKLELVVDTTKIWEQPLVLSSGTIDRPIPAGIHEVLLRGLGEAGEGYVRAAPAQAGAVVKRQSVFELSSHGELVFSIDQAPAQVLTLVLFVISEGRALPFRLSYMIDRGKPPPAFGRFFSHTTSGVGVLEARTGEVGQGMLWESARPVSKKASYPDAIGRVEIKLGDDLVPGRHSVRVRWASETQELKRSHSAAASPARVFVRPVLVGQGEAPSETTFRLWTEELR